MNKTIITTVICLLIGTLSMQAQKKIKITSKSENGNIVYVGKNTTGTGFYILFTVSGSGFVMDRENGVEQYVPAYGETRLAVLTPSGGGIDCHVKARYSDQSFYNRRQEPQYAYRTPTTNRAPQRTVNHSPRRYSQPVASRTPQPQTYRQPQPAPQPAPQPVANRTPQRTVTTPPPATNNMTKGIVLFTQDACMRSKNSREFLDKNHISFKDYNISGNESNASIMWRQLEKAGFKGGSISMPVAVVDGKVHQNITDLNAFLEGLKAKK